MGVSGEPPTPYGTYRNIFLSEPEYAGLEADYPDRLERFIEEMSRYRAANGRTYSNYAAALRRWTDNDNKGSRKERHTRLFLQGGRELMTNGIDEMILNMTETAATPEDYTGGDGLLYCGKCRTPKEAYFTEGKSLFGRDRHPRECDCKRADREDREASRRHLDTVERLKRRGFYRHGNAGLDV